VGDLFPNSFNWAAEAVLCDSPPGFLLDLAAAFGETGDHVRRHLADFKIAGVVLDLIAESPQPFAQFVKVMVLDKLLGAVHALRLEGLPTPFHWVEGGVHHHAVRVEMGVQFPAGVMAERGAHEVAGRPFTVLAGHPHPRFREFLQLGHGQPDRPVVQFNDPLVLAERHDRNALRWPDCEVVKDAPVRHLPAVFAPGGI